MKILLIGEYYSENLGDPLLCQSVERILAEGYPEAEIVHDVVNAAFTLRKEFHTSVNDTSKRWGQQYWGSIVFPTIEILTPGP